MRQAAISTAYAVEMLPGDALAEPGRPTPAAPRPEPAADRRAGARRAAVLREIESARQGLGIRALAEATGLHDNTVRFHLERLVAEGLDERRTGASRGPGRPPLTFVRRRDAAGAGRDNYELLARVLAHRLGGGPDAVSAAEAAGREWGLGTRRDAPSSSRSGPGDPWGDALDELARVLDGAGFAPEVAEDGEVAEDDAVAAGAGQATGTGEARRSATVRVHNCPFLRLAREDRAVPCAVHLGLMEGVLEAAGGAAAVERLEPFVTPSLCLAHVRATPAGAPSPAPV